MGCFLGCFGGEKSQKRRKHRAHRSSPQRQRNRIQNVQQENKITAEQSVAETTPANLTLEVLELGNKHEVVEQGSPSLSPSPKKSPSPSPRKRVTFNSNVTTYEHVRVHDSIESLPDCAANEEEKQEDLKSSSRSQSLSKDDDSVASSVASYPPNHRYHNARESDDEAEEYGDSDLEDLDDEDEDDDEYDYYSDEDTNARFPGHQVWSESVVTASMESRTGSSSPPVMRQEVDSLMVNTQLPDEEVKEFGSKTNARDRSDYINSVLNPVENITQWKAAKSKGTALLKPQKENFANFEAPRMSFSSEPIFRQAPSSFKAKSHQSKNANQEIAVDASLSNWLGSPEVAPSKKTSFSGFETITKSPQTTTSEGCTSPMSFEDRPILGALTVEELRQISAAPSPRKSPSRSPDEMPIIGSVGTYWNDSGSTKHSGAAASFKGIPNTTSKYREDKKVNWHSTPFETRLDRALNRGAA
ncbi:protein JASON [Salvia miltiorrhiza]|uniref:protein JASON n=1 Tax=Salvia miltiorrhiza TaxID=226208 RepID=UPI0025AC0F23|nr:protein JASON [Salvia miltiorrhiza]